MNGTFIWRDKEFRRISDVIDEGLKLSGADLDNFRESYYAKYPHGPENIGYFSGYYDSKTMAEIQRKFKTGHPIFGRTIPTPDEAFDAGKKLGAAARVEK